MSAALGSCQTNPPPAQGRWGEAVLYGSSNIETRIVGKPPIAKCLTVQQNSLDTDSIACNPAPEAKFQVSRTAGCTALAGPNRDETSVGGLRRIAAEAPRDWRPPNPSPMNPVPGGTQSFASAAENRQVPTHFPGTSIARPPAPEAKFQVSRAPGFAALGRIQQG